MNRVTNPPVNPTSVVAADHPQPVAVAEPLPVVAADPLQPVADDPWQAVADNQPVVPVQNQIFLLILPREAKDRRMNLRLAVRTFLMLV